ncbi:hypothetical protein J6590_040384 [Homalodisca vitripennis]|nr:hypothetical protein J6590_040384 [Homalodisca vitripennis]
MSSDNVTLMSYTLCSRFPPSSPERHVGRNMISMTSFRPIDRVRGRVQRLSQNNRIKQRPAWLLLGWVTAKRSCLCKRSACPAVDGGFCAAISDSILPRGAIITREKNESRGIAIYPALCSCKDH